MGIIEVSVPRQVDIFLTNKWRISRPPSIPTQKVDAPELPEGDIHYCSGWMLPKTIEINSCVIPNSLEDLGEFLAICPGTLGNLISHLHRNLPEPHQLSAPQPSGTLSAICPGTLQNLISNLHQNSWKASAPEPSGTSLAICTGTLRNLISYLPRNSPEPHQLSSPKPFGTSSAICTGTLRNLISHLHRKDPEPSGTFSGTWCCSCTGSHQSYSGLKTP